MDQRPVSRSSNLATGGMAVPANMRPSSRGGMAPPGTGYGAGPPGSSLRGGMMAPGSRAGVRPGSGVRGSARPGTGAQGDLNMSDRPVTQQGMSGMRTAGLGPGRQVQDKSFFLTELRQKKQELSKVLEDMQQEMDSLHKDNGTHAKLLVKFEQLRKEVKVLQGQLADYNIILDKVGTQTPPEQIEQQYMDLKASNDVERKRVDAVYTDRASREQRTKDVENQILQIQKGMEDKLNELAPTKREQYHQLQKENVGLMAGISTMELEYEEVCSMVNAAEGELAHNNVKQRALSLQDQIKGLEDRKHDLEQEENKLHLTPEEQRHQLKQKIRQDNEDIAGAEVQIKEVQEQIRRVEAKGGGASMGGPPAGGSNGMDTQEKYQHLLQQEKELTDFIQNFDNNKAQVLRQMAAHKTNIVSFLERVSKGLSAQGNLPSQRRFREMQDELEYKKIQMENAQTTQTRLQQELDLRKSELEKINTLEDKIKMELGSLNTKIESMNEELVTFTRLDLLKEKAEDTKRRLEAARVRLLREKDLTKAQVVEKNTKFEAKKTQLQENDLYVSLEKLETKMRSLEQNIFQMSDYIKAKEKETDCKPFLTEITNVCEELNQECQKAARL